MAFVALHMGVLVFPTYCGILTMRETRRGTRASTVEHARIDQAVVAALPPGDVGAGRDLATAGTATRPPQLGRPEDDQLRRRDSVALDHAER